MSRLANTFIDKCLSGDALLEEVEDYVSQWHNTDIDCELHEFLGLSEIEYDLWFANASILPYILEARVKRKSINEYLNSANNFQLAARAPSIEEAEKIKKWLIDAGRFI